jgi:hypothetical protein
MSKLFPQTQVIDVQTGQVLLQCSVEDSAKAYAFAAEMEALGLDIKVINPTLADTLSASLGLNQDAMREYQQSMEDELEHHDGSCCFEENNPDKKIN